MRAKATSSTTLFTASVTAMVLFPSWSVSTLSLRFPTAARYSVAEKKFLAGKQPTGRIIAADDVAQLILFLCGPSSSDINGSILPIDAAWGAS